MPMTQSAYAHPTSLRALIKPEEDWTKISDFGKRRKIQNRLAQRKYRKLDPVNSGSLYSPGKA